VRLIFRPNQLRRNAKLVPRPAQAASST
jgi:hypothetical protein